MFFLLYLFWETSNNISNHSLLGKVVTEPYDSNKKSSSWRDNKFSSQEMFLLQDLQRLFPSYYMINYCSQFKSNYKHNPNLSIALILKLILTLILSWALLSPWYWCFTMPWKTPQKKNLSKFFWELGLENRVKNSLIIEKLRYYLQQNIAIPNQVRSTTDLFQINMSNFYALSHLSELWSCKSIIPTNFALL